MIIDNIRKKMKKKKFVLIILKLHCNLKFSSRAAYEIHCTENARKIHCGEDCPKPL